MAVASRTSGAAVPAPTTNRDSLAIGAISCVIIGIVGLQAFASFINPGRWGWPFIAYPMYKTPHFDGERVLYDFEVYAVHDDGSESLISLADVPYWIFKHKVVDGLIRRDRESVQPLIAAYCERTRKEVVEVRLQDMGVGLSRDGLVQGLAPETLATMTVGCRE